jgi:hypothetical protein
MINRDLRYLTPHADLTGARSGAGRPRLVNLEQYKREPLDAARARVAAAGGQSLADLLQRLSGPDAPEVSGELRRRA